MPVDVLDRRRDIVQTVVVQDIVVVIVVVLDVGRREVRGRHLVGHVQTVVVAAVIVVVAVVVIAAPQDPVVDAVPLQGHLVRLVRIVPFPSHRRGCCSPSQQLVHCRSRMS